MKILITAVVITTAIFLTLALGVLFYVENNPNYYHQALWEDINELRVQNNLKPFIYSESLCLVGKERLLDIRSDFSHRKFYEQITRFKSESGYYRIGENLIRDSRYFQLFNNMYIQWSNSPDHRSNILDQNFTHSCLVVDGNYAVQVFGSY